MKTFAGRKLGRPTAARFLLLRNLATSLIQHEKVMTTVPKAKEVSRYAQKIITQAKHPEAITARRRTARLIMTPDAHKKLFEVLVPRYQARSGGYVQVIRTGIRSGDSAPMALVRLVP